MMGAWLRRFNLTMQWVRVLGCERHCNSAVGERAVGSRPWLQRAVGSRPWLQRAVGAERTLAAGVV